MVKRVEMVADSVKVFISKDCAFCALVDPVLLYAVQLGYIGLIQRIEFQDKQNYLRTIEFIAKKYQQKRTYPILLVYHAGKEVMVPAHVIDEIIDIMTSLDDQTVLRIIVGELTWESLGDALVQPTSKLILGISDALKSP
ncbi:MAG: hypothetical protein ACFFCW_03800 [Candidatus Hodarchaeota archaeon]